VAQPALDASGHFRPDLPREKVRDQGDRLYAVSPFARSLVIYDTATYQEVTVMTDLGGTPARIVVPDIQNR
jgi:hypothetical protein